MEKVISVQNLKKTFKKDTAVENVSFELMAGNIMGLLGTNGAGMYFNINVRDIIQNPFCVRKVLSFYSNEFYADNGKEHLDFIQTQLDNQKHSTFKYNREWFMFMGFHTYKPAVLWFHQIENGQTTEIYDIRKDSRYRFV